MIFASTRPGVLPESPPESDGTAIAEAAEAMVNSGDIGDQEPLAVMDLLSTIETDGAASAILRAMRGLDPRLGALNATRHSSRCPGCAMDRAAPVRHAARRFGPITWPMCMGLRRIARDARHHRRDPFQARALGHHHPRGSRRRRSSRPSSPGCAGDGVAMGWRESVSKTMVRGPDGYIYPQKTAARLWRLFGEANKWREV